MKNIFITGVSSGIGHALANYYLQQGEKVYGLSRRTPADLIATNGQFIFHECDLANFDDVQKALQALPLAGTTLDLVILNAALLGRIEDLKITPLSELQHLMDVNVWANKILLDLLLKQCANVSQVVAISSGAAASPERGWGGYSISKAALNMLIALYAKENPQIHFCSLAPGVIDTPMQADLASRPADARFPSLEMLKSLRGTPVMPSTQEVAPKLIAAFEAARTHPSGAFLSLDQLVKKRWFG